MIPTERLFFMLGSLLIFLGGLYYNKKFFKSNKAKLKAAFVTAFLIMLYDFVWENLGYILNWWKSNQALFYIGFAPADILFDIFFFMAGLSFFLPDKEDVSYAIIFLTIMGLTSEVLENELVNIGLMDYMTGYGINYSIIYALPIYVLSWFVFYKTFYIFYRMYQNRMSFTKSFSIAFLKK